VIQPVFGIVQQLYHLRLPFLASLQGIANVFTDVDEQYFARGNRI
jgi:alcohol dehydrogenase YqhD (iron-dependent ADH family)